MTFKVLLATGVSFSALMFSALAGMALAHDGHRHDTPLTTAPTELKPFGTESHDPAQSAGGVPLWSGLGTLIYAPLKATFCLLGGIASGLTAIASPPTAGKVAMASCGGAWIVTPNVVRGREPVKFVGDTTLTPSRSTAAR